MMPVVAVTLVGDEDGDLVRDGCDLDPHLTSVGKVKGQRCHDPAANMKLTRGYRKR